MSDAHPDTHEAHEGPIKTPKQLMVAVAAAFIVPVVVIALLVAYVTADNKPAAGSDGLNAQAVAQRLQPVGRVAVRDASDAASLKSGEQVFQAQCVACHGAGVAGAPKLADAQAWGPRIKNGYEALLTAALKGKGAMGAQGGGDHSDLEIGRAVVYMANQAGAKFEEPKAPAAAAQGGEKKDDAATATATAAAPAVAQAPAAPPAADAKPAAAADAAGGAAVPALYTQACQVCHAAGVAGAPKLGDKAAWAPRLGQGIEGLTASVVKGKGAMPPRGGSAASDAEIKTVVTYMASSVK